MLDVQDLHAGYGRVEVLRSLTFRVGHGESVALLGPNGHGKTTALETVSGLIRATGGDIRLDGVSVVRSRPAAIVNAGVTHIPQGSPLFPRLTVHESLWLAGRRRTVKANRAQNIDRVQQLFPKLSQRRNQLVGSLSGGERQMVAIGMGLMTEPRLLILDEPTLGLAPKVRHEIAAALHEVRATGLSMLIADGDVDFLFDVTDRWYLVELGRITGEGTAEHRPSDKEVMEMYIGGADHHTTAEGASHG